MKKSFILVIVLLLNSDLVWAEKTRQPETAQQSGEVFVYSDHGRRDPFWSLIKNGVIVNYDNDIQLADMVLEGIIAGTDGKNLAIINNNIVKANDRIGLFVVDKIEINKVVLMKGQEIFELTIKKEK